jgi:uncharacterized protein YebE (UPF0316 family)
MDALLGALLIFFLRLCDVSLGTLRSLYVVRGYRQVAVPLAFVESLVWIIAISRIMAEVTNGNYYNMLAYAGGFACGTLIGMTLEQWIASGWILVSSRAKGATGSRRSCSSSPLGGAGMSCWSWSARRTRSPSSPSTR